ncbi:MAG: MarR family transcriptional regulator [Alphaproteobacteria bacterium]|nr:MarR family transcriptional regulator [Alphaproteobacteria bacterium]
MSDAKGAEPRPQAFPLYLHDEALKQGVDLLFSAFAEVFGDGDTVLKAARLGRAHRRALYFIARQPGITVADLLARLKITKQSLSRVINELLADGYVERRTAATDRRMRELHLTPKGTVLEQRLWEAQRPRLARAFREAGPDSVAGFRRVLDALSTARGEKRR